MSEFQAFCGLQSPQRGNYIVIFKTIYIFIIFIFYYFYYFLMPTPSSLHLRENFLLGTTSKRFGNMFTFLYPCH